MGDYFSIERFWSSIPKILPQLSVTFAIVIVSMVIGTLLALIVAALEIKKIPVLQQILKVYVSYMRGTPLLVQMMVVYYGLPLIMQTIFGIDVNSWSPIIFVDIAFILNEGAFLGEIFRGAILSIPIEQTEAAYSIGMTGMQTFARIILPQIIRIIIPAYGVDLIGVFHNTSLVFTIGGILDIMGKAKILGTATGHTLEGYVVVALVYVVISLILKIFFYLIDKKLEFERR